MPEFGKRSEECLESCDPRIQEVLREAIKHYDFAVIKGHRGEDEQNEAFDTGNSKLRFPQSKHNKHPAQAVDVVPYPVDWENQQRFNLMKGDYQPHTGAVKKASFTVQKSHKGKNK